MLAADIADTDYAQLLVGVARHECPGLLLGAHGVAPSKGSLARRVARVLDGKTVRRPAARSFAAGVFVGAIAVAAPLAALTLTPAKPEPVKPPSVAAATSPAAVDTSQTYGPPGAPTDLPHIIAQGVSTAVAAATGPMKRSNPAKQPWKGPRKPARTPSTPRRMRRTMRARRPRSRFANPNCTIAEIARGDGHYTRICRGDARSRTAVRTACQLPTSLACERSALRPNTPAT